MKMVNIDYKLILILLLFLTDTLKLQVQWQNPSQGIYGGRVTILGKFGNNLFAGTESGGIYISVNNGFSWSAANLEVAMFF